MSYCCNNLTAAGLPVTFKGHHDMFYVCGIITCETCKLYVCLESLSQLVHMQWQMNSWGSFLSVMSVVSLSTLCLQASCPLPSSNWVPFSRCLVPFEAFMDEDMGGCYALIHKHQTESTDSNFSVRHLTSLCLKAKMTLSSEDTHRG